MKNEELGESILAEIRDIRERLDRLERRVDELARRLAQPREGWVRTSVGGLDEMLGGGIPAAHVVLLHGPTGALKTSLSLYVLAKNQAQGRKSLYLSLEEDRGSLLRTMQGLGIVGEDFIVDIASLRTEHGIQEEAGDWLGILSSYLKKKAEDGLELLVIDSLDALYAMAEMLAPQRDLLRFFKFLRDAQITSLLVLEDGGFPHQEDRLADGVLDVAPREVEGGLVSLWLRCVKMRHAEHSRDFHRLEFADGEFRVRPILPL